MDMHGIIRMLFKGTSELGLFNSSVPLKYQTCFIVLNFYWNQDSIKENGSKRRRVIRMEESSSSEDEESDVDMLEQDEEEMGK